MSSAPTLGPVAFAGFEVPERISFGGKQKLVVHSMPGGGRVVDAMGPDDAPIRWQGVFSGSGAPERVRTLERLRRAGLPMLLAWDGWRFKVVIESFAANVTNSNWIPYSIELCVLSSLTGSAVDWLVSATAPALSIGNLSEAALEQNIETAGAALSHRSFAIVVAASGQLAQLVTRRAFPGRSV